VSRVAAQACCNDHTYSPSLFAPLLRTSVAFGGDDGIGISVTQSVVIRKFHLITGFILHMKNMS
jgi:hypothetical protein